MPKIISTSNSWKAVSVPGDFAADESLAFLSSFEECLPEKDCENRSHASKKKAIKRKADVALCNLQKNTTPIRKKKNKEYKNIVSIAQGAEINCNPEVTEDGNDTEKSIECDLRSEIDVSCWKSLNISEVVLQAIAQMGFTEPTEIQKLVIPIAIRDRLDIIGAAETGSGKTLAFGIPIVEQILADKFSNEKETILSGIRALIFAPTRELVMQIRNQIQHLLKFTLIKVESIVGGLSLQKQERLLKRNPQIIIATPGRFSALMTLAETSNYLVDWSKLQCLVIDETDRMVEKGHFIELRKILDTIRKSASEKIQTFVFSATLTYTHPSAKKHSHSNASESKAEEKINKLVEITGIRKKKCRIIDITGKRGTAERVIEARINCKNLLEKDTSLVYLLHRYPGRTLVFTNSVDASRRLHGILKQLMYKPPPLMLHARMLQKKRLGNLEKFAQEENSVLLATDVAARGLDIQQIEHVIHYQLPRTAELYIHRCGRTARATKEGLAILLIDPQDVYYYHRICRNLDREKDLPMFPVDSSHLYNVLKERVAAAVAVEALEHRLKKVCSKQAWLEKAAASADLDLDESECKRDTRAELIEDLQKEKKILLAKLKRLLSQPLPPNNIEIKKTRYVTAEMASKYGKFSTPKAISSLADNMKYEKLLKKKCRTVFVKHFKTSRKKKNKRK